MAIGFLPTARLHSQRSTEGRTDPRPTLSSLSSSLTSVTGQCGSTAAPLMAVLDGRPWKFRSGTRHPPVTGACLSDWTLTTYSRAEPERRLLASVALV